MSDASTGPGVPDNDGTALDSAILRQLMESVPDRIYFKDRQSRFVRNNLAHARSLGVASPEDCVGKTDADFFSREHAERAFMDEQVIIHTGRPIIAKIERLTMRDGKQGWASTTKMPWRDATGRIIGTFGLTRDVTDTKDAEEKLLQERNLLRTIIDHLPSRVYVKDLSSRYLINNQAHLRALGIESQDQARGRTTTDFFPGERGRQAIADDRKVLDTTQPIIDQEKSDFGAEGRTHWSLTTKVPLRDVRDRIVGIVGISHDITERKRIEQELQRRTAEMEEDVRMARQIQEAFFPRRYPVFPRNTPAERSALRFAHRYVPAATLGGDFFDIIQLSDTRCGVLVCDVMGHGVRAGLLTALIRGVVEELGPRADDPARVLAEINHGLIPVINATGQPVFATAFYGVVDTAAATLTHANAGHPPPLVLRGATGAVEPLALDNPEPAAGLMEDFAYSRHAVPFQPGDVLLGYTDGLFEASDASGAMFGDTRLHDQLSGARGVPGSEIIERMMKDVEAFTGRKDFDDDLCLLVVESVKPAPAP